MNSSKEHKTDTTTGFGSSGDLNGGRFYRKDGSVNILKKGVGLLESQSWFHTMLMLSTTRFLIVLFSSFILINIFFAFIYLAIGIENFEGTEKGTWLEDFLHAFFFSADTFTTVGYGYVSPSSVSASAVAAFEAFLGLLGFAIASGLFYARFSKPQAFIRFSDSALISPYKKGKALMIQMVSFKNNHLTNAEATLIAALRINENGELKNIFYPLELEVSKVKTLAMNWTLVHVLDEESPLQMHINNLKNVQIEIMVHVNAFDETFAKTVVARTSYLADEMIINASYRKMFHPNEEKTATILNVDRLNDIEQH